MGHITWELSLGSFRLGTLGISCEEARLRGFNLNFRLETFTRHFTFGKFHCATFACGLALESSRHEFLLVILRLECVTSELLLRLEIVAWKASSRELVSW